MKNEQTQPSKPENSIARLDFIRGFFSTLTKLAAACVVAFLLFSFLNKTDAPASPELSAGGIESGIYLCVTPGKGAECTVISDEERANVSASLLIENGGDPYVSEPFAVYKKVPAGTALPFGFDPSKLRYMKKGDPAAERIDAGELLTILPPDATAKVVLTADGETVLTGTEFYLLPFLTGGAYGA